VLAGSYSGGVVLTFSVFSGGGWRNLNGKLGKSKKNLQRVKMF